MELINVINANYILVKDTSLFNKLILGLCNISDIDSNDYIKEMVNNEKHLGLFHTKLEWTPYVLNTIFRLLGNITTYTPDINYKDSSISKVNCNLIFVT